MNSAEMIGNNESLLTETLLRLPTTALLKFKCVSKPWLSLISNPHFCLCHTRHHQRYGFLEPTALMLKDDQEVHPDFYMVPLKDSSKVPFSEDDYCPTFKIRQSCDGIFLYPLQSCNGLFLWKFFDDGDDDDDDGCLCRYFICNPTTKKFKILSYLRNPYSQFYVNLAFDPLKSSHYKIISIKEVSLESYTFEMGIFNFEMEIYSSATNSWNASKISFQVDRRKGIRFHDAIFCNGMLYWKSRENESLRLDVEKECLQKMPMPMPMPWRRASTFGNFRYFGETRGILYLGEIYYRDDLELNIYEMAGDHSNWFLKHHLHLADVMKVLPEIKLGCCRDSPGISGLSFIQSEEGEEPKVVAWADGKIISYDFNDGAWKMLYDPGHCFKIGSPYPRYFTHLHDHSFRGCKFFANLSDI